MNRWPGSRSDSDRQASERSSRAARRTLSRLDIPETGSDSGEDNFDDCETSFHHNLDGEGGDLDDSMDAAQRAAAELARQRSLPVEDADFENDPDSWKKEVKAKFDQHDVTFWFNTVESQLKKHGINRQWDKKDAIVAILPENIVEECKPILRLSQQDAGTHIYKTLKSEIIQLFGERDEDAFKKALALKLTGRPSALGKKLTHIICPGVKPFDGCHCARMVYGFWESNLTPPIKTKIAGKRFNKDTYQELFKLADEAWLANGGVDRPPAVVAAVPPPSQAAAVEPAVQGDAPQVAAVAPRGGRGGRGGRGQRGGNRGGRGSYNNSNNSNRQNSNSNQNNQNNSNSSDNKSHQKGPKHPDLPNKASWACAQHWKKGRGAPYCSDPLVCQWVNVVAPRTSSA